MLLLKFMIHDEHYVISDGGETSNRDGERYGCPDRADQGARKVGGPAGGRVEMKMICCSKQAMVRELLVKENIW